MTFSTSCRLCLIAALALGACNGPAPGPAPPAASQPTARAGSPADAATSEPLIVSAAASTKEAIESLAEKFKARIGTEVKVNPGPSSGLASQIIAGAPA